MKNKYIEWLMAAVALILIAVFFFHATSKIKQENQEEQKTYLEKRIEIYKNNNYLFGGFKC